MDDIEYSLMLREINDLLRSLKMEDANSIYHLNYASMSSAQRAEVLGNIAFYDRNLQSAIDNYELAITLNPERLIARYQYLVGVVEERSGNLAKAFERYQAAIGADPGFVDAYIELGGLLGKIHEFEGAAQCYRDALLISPSDPHNLNNLKVVLFQLAQQDPDRFGVELKEIDGRLATDLTNCDPGVLQRHSW